jgi:hypothetical protein
MTSARVLVGQLLLASTVGVSSLLGFACGCRHEGADAPPETPEEPQSIGTCAVPGVESAHRVEVVALPAGCRFNVNGYASEPRVVHSAEEYAETVSCEGAVAPTLDFAASDLYVMRYSMSPAFGGRETVDDGTTVTFITRFRPNCPDDPMPMPMDVTYGFLLPKGATRTFNEATCSLPQRRC